MEIKQEISKMGGMDKILVVLMIGGLMVAAVSLFRGIWLSRQVQVVYEPMGIEKEKILIVDIEGAVNNPGVYELPDGSRIKDLLVLAGGYSDKADRAYCEKVINLAQPLTDGMKLLIPNVGDTPLVPGYIEANNVQSVISVNTSSVEELNTLWGIGEVKAGNIVKNRPYQSLEELVEKKIIFRSVLEKNRGRLVL